MRDDLLQRRRLSYLLNDWDDVNLPYEKNYENLEEQVVKFFENGSELIYPAKSYFVAIVYAKCLERYFGEDFYQSLNDNDLLPDDKYFQPYTADIDTYNTILASIGDIWQYKSIEKTVGYFKKEFLVD